jgi:hypothetical protein
MHHGILKTKWKKESLGKTHSFLLNFESHNKKRIGRRQREKRAVRERISGSGGKIRRGKIFCKTYIAHFSLRRRESHYRTKGGRMKAKSTKNRTN